MTIPDTVLEQLGDVDCRFFKFGNHFNLALVEPDVESFSFFHT